MHVDVEALHELPGDKAAATAWISLADVSTATLLACLGALHLRRAVTCSRTHSAATSHLWDFKCGGDPFASWSFLPLHALAAAAATSWLVLTLRASGQLLTRQQPDAAASTGGSSNRRMCEMFIGAWCLCWFAPASPWAGTDDCTDHDESCSSWARVQGGQSECTRNHAFMADKCPRACKLCVAAGDRLFSWHAVTTAVGPRACTLLVATTLLVVSAARLLLASLSEDSRRRLGLIVRLTLRPLHLAAAVFMRTPFGPLVLGLLKLLRACLAQLGRLLRLVVSLLGACFNFGRRRLILALGGSVEHGDFDAPFSVKAR